MDLGLHPTELSVFPLGLAMKRSPLAIALWRYKRADKAADRSQATDDLRDVISERLPLVAAHISAFDLVTFVPGRQSRTSTVRELFSGTPWGRANRIDPHLEVLDYDGDTHVADDERFRSRRVSGHVLLLDDTFTTGATSFSAARALLNAGADHVSIVVIGRHSDPGWLSDIYLQHISDRQADGEFCPECFAGLEDHPTTLAHGASNEVDPWRAPEPVLDFGPPDEDLWNPHRNEETRESVRPVPAFSAGAPTNNPSVPSSQTSPPLTGARLPRVLKWLGFGVFVLVSLGAYIDQSVVSVPSEPRVETPERRISDRADGREAAIDLILENARDFNMVGVPRDPIAEGIEHVCTEFVARGRDLGDYTDEMSLLATNESERGVLPFVTYIGAVVFEDSETIC